jgi:hypothetical protein
MTAMRRTNLPGHALTGEGVAHEKRRDGRWQSTTSRLGVGLCECGETSPELTSNNQRKAWHAQHKDAVRGAFDGAPGHG